MVKLHRLKHNQTLQASEIENNLKQRHAGLSECLLLHQAEGQVETLAFCAKAPRGPSISNYHPLSHDYDVSQVAEVKQGHNVISYWYVRFQMSNINIEECRLLKTCKIIIEEQSENIAHRVCWGV